MLAATYGDRVVYRRQFDSQLHLHAIEAGLLHQSAILVKRRAPVDPDTPGDIATRDCAAMMRVTSGESIDP
jgi:hypothetical protein